MLFDMLGELADKYDRVIVDSPPLSQGVNARVLSASCAASILIRSTRPSQRHQIEQANQLLQSVGANVIGVVINEVESARPAGRAAIANQIVRRALPVARPINSSPWETSGWRHERDEYWKGQCGLMPEIRNQEDSDGTAMSTLVQQPAARVTASRPGPMASFKSKSIPTAPRKLMSLHARPQMEKILHRESARCKRNGHEFSLVLIAAADTRVKHHLCRLARLLCKRARLTDEIGGLIKNAWQWCYQTPALGRRGICAALHRIRLSQGAFARMQGANLSQSNVR